MEEGALRQFYYVKNDDEMPFYSRPSGTANGFPQVQRLHPFKGTKLTEALQWFWFGLNLTADIKESLQAWRSYTADGVAFNNGSWGLNLCRDYVSGARLKPPFPFPQMGRLICGGNVICGVEVGKEKVAGIPKGLDVLKVETINVRQSLPKGISYETHPWLIHHATIIRPENTANNVNGRRRVNPFPQLGGREGRPIYYPLFSDGDVYYPMRMLEKLPLNSPVPSPYNPPW
jgi:hypothetical protein